MDVKKKIEELMNSKGWTKYRLAKNSGLPQSTITSLLSGKVNKPSTESLTKIANALGVSVGVLLGESEEHTVRYHDEEGEITRELLNTLKSLTDDDNYFLEELHEELLEVFLSSVGTGGEGEKFNEWYQKYLTLSGEDKTEDDDQYAVEEFNRIFDYRSVKDTVLKTSSYSAKEYLLNELTSIARKHNIKPPSESSIDPNGGNNSIRFNDILEKMILDENGEEIVLSKEQREVLYKLTLAALDAVKK